MHCAHRCATPCAWKCDAHVLMCNALRTSMCNALCMEVRCTCINVQKRFSMHCRNAMLWTMPYQQGSALWGRSGVQCCRQRQAAWQQAAVSWQSWWVLCRRAGGEVEEGKGKAVEGRAGEGMGMGLDLETRVKNAHGSRGGGWREAGERGKYEGPSVAAAQGTPRESPRWSQREGRTVVYVVIRVIFFFRCKCA